MPAARLPTAADMDGPTEEGEWLMVMQVRRHGLVPPALSSGAPSFGRSRRLPRRLPLPRRRGALACRTSPPTCRSPQSRPRPSCGPISKLPRLSGCSIAGVSAL
eukprot:9792392-Alexandrium_andersonii.AAC.1